MNCPWPANSNLLKCFYSQTPINPVDKVANHIKAGAIRCACCANVIARGTWQMINGHFSMPLCNIVTGVIPCICKHDQYSHAECSLICPWRVYLSTLHVQFFRCTMQFLFRFCCLMVSIHLTQRYDTSDLSLNVVRTYRLHWYDTVL